MIKPEAKAITAPDPSISEILPGLFLGSIDSANNEEKLNVHGVKAIKYKYLCLHVVYHLSEKMYPMFDKGANFIAENLKVGGVVVHCMAGVSRSPTIVMAYLIKHGGKTAEEAIKLVMEKRHKVENRSFHKCLKDYEKYLKSDKKIKKL